MIEPQDPKETLPIGETAYKHTNRSVTTTGNYLLQHARNPVDCYEWKSQPVEQTKRDGKPVFLSLAFAASHWCHLMELESFEDEAIAALLIEHFVVHRGE